MRLRRILDTLLRALRRRVEPRPAPPRPPARSTQLALFPAPVDGQPALFDWTP